MMPLITTADERLARPSKSNIAIFGPSGIGKTYLARSLDPATTLFLDGEAGTKALGDWRGDTIDMRKAAGVTGMHPWELARALACLLAGPDLSDYTLTKDGRLPGPYSPEAHAHYAKTLGEPAELFGRYGAVFVDSITVASRWSFAWSSTQPRALSEKTGNPDTRGIYGLHGQEMVKWLTTLQHAPISMIVVGILDVEKDDLGRVTFSPQIEGSKTARELPGIFDNVATLTRFTPQDSNFLHDMGTGTVRAIVTGPNPWGLPGKDRSGCLDLIEQPDLRKLLDKMAGGKRRDTTPTTAIGAPTIGDAATILS